MFEPEHKLRHLPFFEAIAGSTEGSHEWRAATAGLVVLRLVDAWLEDGPSACWDDGWGVRSVRTVLEEESAPLMRSILGRVVDALEQRRPDIHVVITPLMAYGRALEYEAHWPLAADVYQTVLAHLHPLHDSDASISAQLRLGQCYRNLNMLGSAEAAFAAASGIASSVGDIVGVLRARIGEARIAQVRGNLPEAEAILESTIAQAAGSEFADVRSRALHDRANVAHFRGQYELAIRYAYEALEQAQSATEHDRILGDIAVSFLELGVYTAARDAYLVLSTTAQEQYTRWGATINLMDIAAKTAMETLFEGYRRELIGAELPPYLATAYEVNVGTGYQMLGNPTRAKSHLRRALALATEHGFTQYVFEVEGALNELHGPTPLRTRPEELSLDVAEVAGALRDLRETAGLAR